MKRPTPLFQCLRHGAICLLAGLLAVSATAQEIRSVSDLDQRVAPKSLLQKSIAYEIKDYTLEFTGFTIAGAQYLFKSDVPGTRPKEPEFIYQGIYDMTIARKLPNTLTYGINSRLYTQNPRVGNPTNKLDKRTEGRVDVYVKGTWGQLSYGDYNVRDTLLISGRNSLTGEANLIYDGYLNPSLERAFRYRARYSSWLVDLAIDDDGENWDAALQHRTKVGIFEKAFSLNYSKGKMLDRYDRQAWNLGHQLIYGSWDLSMGVTWEELTPAGNFGTFDRVAASVGTGWKRERLSLGAGLLLTEVDSGDLGVVATAGLRYDFSRGRSFNAGYIHSDTQGLTTDGVPFAEAYLSGLRLSFAYRY